MTLGEFIKDYRKTHAMSQAAFATVSGISKGYISMLEQNKNPATGLPIAPTIDIFSKVAAAVGISTNDLFRLVDSRQPVSMCAPLPSNVVRLPASRPTVPLVGQIACGTPILAEENIEGYVELPAHVRADYALTCKGDSMINAGIRDGDVVYIRQQAEVENGQIAAVMVDDGEATLKRFYRDGDTVTLIAENPAVPPMVFTGEDINRLRVIGLSVAYIHLLEK